MARSSMTQQIRIYEVDHPATQAWKRQRLSKAQIALPPWLILVPVDFERDDVGEKFRCSPPREAGLRKFHVVEHHLRVLIDDM